MHFNRLAPETVGNEYWVPYPKNKDWKVGNDLVEKAWAGKVTFIKAEKYVCKEGKCDLRKYADNQHLRPTYLLEHGTWVDDVFSSNEK